MEPMHFLSRLAALVPAPMRHALRYHGTLAPNSKWRPLIVPKAPSPPTATPADCTDAGPATAPPSRDTRLTWAELMLRVFARDVLKCPRCEGRLRIIATVTSPTAVKAILECLGLPARPPPMAPAREREQGELRFEE